MGKNFGVPYHVLFVEDDLLDRDFVFGETGGEVWLVIKRSRITEEVLEAAWAAWETMAAEGGPAHSQAS